jgi:hypothetical protein
MKEFMLYVRNAGNAKAILTQEEHMVFVKKCEVYIKQLQAENKLIAAQPLVREGIVISKKTGVWENNAVDPSKEEQVGYYHIKAASIEEAVTIAKQNPEFEFVPSASIEVRPIKMMEEKTGFVYPNS